MCLDPVFLHQHSCVYRLGPSNLRFSSLLTIVFLLCWSIGVLTRQIPICLLQQDLLVSVEEGVMTVACLWFLLVLIVLALWSIDLDVISITSDVLYTTIMFDE